MKIPKRTPNEIVAKCADLCCKIEAGTPYMALKGKRLDVKENDGRTRIAVPVGYRYRLICLFDGKTTEPVELLSHENYSKKFCL